MVDAIPEISVCVCTYKRPALLRRTLDSLIDQKGRGRFTCSISVADNDRFGSAQSTVAAFAASTKTRVVYSVEPEQNIALARNRSVANASGDFIAFIDDDEFAPPEWLERMLTACQESGADGVLGPVRPHFDQTPPRWLIRGRFCERPEHETGLLLNWRQSRTGNVLFRRSILQGTNPPFREAFGSGGEDQDFFRRMIENGCRFIWCNEAPVFEVVPPERWSRRYFWRRAFLRGQNERLVLTIPSILKSLAAVQIYLILLPFLALAGHDWFMHGSTRLLDHVGKILASLGIRTVGTTYLSG